MIPESTPAIVETPYGKLYISVIPAREESFHMVDRGNVKEFRPMLRVASDPGFEASYASADHWTIRGRAYGVHEVMFFNDLSHVSYASGTAGDFFHPDHKDYYVEGYRNDRGSKVDYDSKTHKLMREAVENACAQFAEENPGWDDLSIYMHLAYKRGREEREAASLRREAEEHDAKAREYSNQEIAVLDKVPNFLKDRLR